MTAQQTPGFRFRKTEGASVTTLDPVWDRVCREAEEVLAAEPALSGLVLTDIINERSLEGAVAYRVASRLDHPDVPANLIRQAFVQACEDDPMIGQALRADIMAVYERDPACVRYLEPVLYFKGFQALSTHRLAHHLWKQGRRDFSYYLQSRASSQF